MMEPMRDLVMAVMLHDGLHGAVFSATYAAEKANSAMLAKSQD